MGVGKELNNVTVKSNVFSMDTCLQEGRNATEQIRR